MSHTVFKSLIEKKYSCNNQDLPTVEDIINQVLYHMCGGPKFDTTCDIISIGHKDNKVTGIVTTFMATFDVIKQAVELGANFIITHEPTWFTATDKTDWCQNDKIYLAKKKYIEDNNITIWRLHDHMHMGSQTDYIYKGLLKEIGWEKYLQPDEQCPWVYQIPTITLGDLSDFFKEKLDMNVIQIIGDKDMPISRVGVLVGGGSLGLGVEEMPMQVMERNNLDLIIAGDITEWTLCAYINDAYQLGFNRAMLTLGHERSEEAGMKHLASWLENYINNVPINFVDAKEPFNYL